MRRWIIYALLLAGLLTLSPGKGKDVSDLIPVELLYVYKEGERIRAQTDTGDFGTGPSLETALQNLKQTASGEIFLETADYLLVSPDAQNLLPELIQVVRPAAEVCVGLGIGEDAAAYLKAHPSPVTVKDIRAGTEKLPMLIGKEGRYWFGYGNGFWRKA